MPSEPYSEVKGVVQRTKQDDAYLRDPLRAFAPSTADVFIPSVLVERYALVDGAEVRGVAGATKQGLQLVEVQEICGLTPEAFAARKPFDQLVAIDPRDRFRLGDSGKISMRAVELIAPIGKGTRGLIVAPPKAGKTQLLEELTHAIHASAPEARIILLLIDERPEEVTHFRRTVPAEVFASSNDQSLEDHIRLAELTMAHVRCELECGRDVVVLIDSLTRMTRAFNLAGRGANRTLSGGIDARALEIPRRFFGLARNIEHGGSVTVLATVLVETGSRMDDLIFEEFKATGNSEIVLDRSLAEARIFPAIDLKASGTRREELLYTPAEMEKLTLLRRALAERDSKSAMLGLLKLLEKAPTNDELLRRLKKKA
ncbi:MULTISPECIES: transcription termination factor Rho [Caldilinea]|uniref:transcription termination factor Rho n=1 Tax=Caldilinea TaxID=233191 RepID=UPI0005C49521|nr:MULTISPECIES: transcription termination factor Rho [Caldilinea]